MFATRGGGRYHHLWTGESVSRYARLFSLSSHRFFSIYERALKVDFWWAYKLSKVNIIKNIFYKTFTKSKQLTVIRNGEKYLLYAFFLQQLKRFENQCNFLWIPHKISKKLVMKIAPRCILSLCLHTLQVQEWIKTVWKF